MELRATPIASSDFVNEFTNKHAEQQVKQQVEALSGLVHTAQSDTPTQH